MIQHILVAADGSEGSRRAAAFAADLAKATGAKVTLLHVLEPIPVVNVGFAEFYGVAHRQPSEEEMRQLRQALQDMAKVFPEGRAEVVLEYGSPAETIVNQAKERGVDLIVVGARGLGAVGRFFVGSVSDRVVHHAECSVTVVH